MNALQLGRIHWFDAFEQPVDFYAPTLIEAVRRPGEIPGPPPIPPPPPPWWLHPSVKPGASIAGLAVIMLLLLQLFFYATGTPLLQGAALWVALAVCGIIAWGIQYLWSSIMETRSRRHEKSL
jgi:hypothetical protein